jgi:hypothetical protein
MFASLDFLVFACRGASSHTGGGAGLSFNGSHTVFMCDWITNQKANYGRSPAQSARNRPLLERIIPAFKTHCWKSETSLCIPQEGCAYTNGCDVSGEGLDTLTLVDFLLVGGDPN